MPRPLDAITDSWTGPRPTVSVVILTLNEEINIADCLASCAWSDDVHVLDSGSTDRTAEIARSRGVPVSVHAFESFGAQRNWAIDHIPLRHDWVFHLDADERFTAPLVEEMQRVVAAGPVHAGYYVANQMIFMGEWIRRAQGYPNYQMRLFHKARVRFEDHGHGQRETPGASIGTLGAPYLHHNFSKGLDDWFARHNRYSTLEALEILRREGEPLGLSGLLSRDRTARRRVLKRLAAGVPCRPTLRRLHMLLVQGAILDGRAGRAYASLIGTYERMIAAKVLSLRAERDRAGRA
ncbi:MAG: glycosyltransferase family 2 protein [Phycisphaeraceae bacterium]|nr:glycosyltransferase family 2 protein [Phycisphaeraceae bacterium]